MFWSASQACLVDRCRYLYLFVLLDDIFTGLAFELDEDLLSHRLPSTHLNR
jgi:hypothetical protein